MKLWRLRLKSQIAFEESSLKEVVEASEEQGGRLPSWVRGGVGFMKKDLKEVGVGPEAGKTCLSSCSRDRSDMMINWKKPLPYVIGCFFFNQQKKQTAGCGFVVSIVM